MTTPAIGHNHGPTLEVGFSFRKHCWAKARRDLLPNLPIEVLRNRVKRAKELGLPYKTYASVRASTGRDVVGFLFSNNALRVLNKAQEMPADRIEKLRALMDAKLVALVHKPLSAAQLSDISAKAGIKLCVGEAPRFGVSWAEIRDHARRPLRAAALPFDGVLVIGDQTLERDWSEAAKLAGYLSAERYFTPL